MSERDPLDDAIDRTVRDMTHVAADGRAVARVMARVREAGAHEPHVRDARAAEGRRWTLTPRVALCSILALLLMLVLGRSWYPLPRHAEDTPVAVSTPQRSPAQQQQQPSQPVAAREFPTPLAAAPSTTQATTARVARGRVVTPSSVANGPADSSEGRTQLDTPPLESDITLASITPAPLGEAPAIHVEPLMTSSLQVDDIPLPSIEVPPVSPERRE